MRKFQNLFFILILIFSYLNWFLLNSLVIKFLILLLKVLRDAGLDEAQAGIKISGRNINNLRYAKDTTVMAESEEELKNLLTKVKEESEKLA